MIKRFDAPSWLIGKPSLSDRSHYNGWWWGRYNDGKKVVFDFDYIWSSWLDGFEQGYRERLLSDR